MLMKRGGQVIYAGPLGRHSHKLVEYFEVSIEVFLPIALTSYFEHCMLFIYIYESNVNLYIYFDSGYPRGFKNKGWL